MNTQHSTAHMNKNFELKTCGVLMGRPKLEILASNGMATFAMPFSITLNARHTHIKQMHTCIHRHPTHAQTHTHIIQMQTYTHARAHTHAHHTDTHRHTHTHHTGTHRHRHTHTHRHTDTQTHTHTHIHTDTQTHTHTHTHNMCCVCVCMCVHMAINKIILDHTMQWVAKLKALMYSDI